jgi:hypothetical protein
MVGTFDPLELQTMEAALTLYGLAQGTVIDQRTILTYYMFYLFEQNQPIHTFIREAHNGGASMHMIMSALQLFKTEEKTVQMLTQFLPQEKFIMNSSEGLNEVSHQAFSIEEITNFLNASGVKCGMQFIDWTPDLVKFFL